MSELEMIVSSVYSWLKDLRSHFDIYEERNTAKSVFPGHCVVAYHNEMFDISELETVLLRHGPTRRSTPPKRSRRRESDDKCMGFAELCIQERAKKTWSVGDAWGIDFQLKKGQEGNPTFLRRDSEVTDEIVREALNEFSFLSDVESDASEEQEVPTISRRPEPIYVNIATIDNPKLEEELRFQWDSTLSSTSLSSTFSFISCGLSEATLDASSSDLDDHSSGTYILVTDKSQTGSKSSITSSCSGATFQTEDDASAWSKEEWRSLGSLGEGPLSHEPSPRNPLKKGKSLDSFNLSATISSSSGSEPEAGVQLRHNRKSVIPIVDTSNLRKAIILPKSPEAQNTYMNIWECYTKAQMRSSLGKPKPIPAPRTKLRRPPPVLIPRSPAVQLSTLEVKKARQAVISLASDETVEPLDVDQLQQPPKKVDNECERLPPLDVIVWMTELMSECESEPDMEIPSVFESNDLLSKAQSPGTYQGHQFSKHQGAQDLMLGNDQSSHDFRDKFDFNNVKKYKMDNHMVKLTKYDVIEKQDGKLLHKNSEGTKTLAENINHCHFEQRSPKEHVIILPDKKKIHLYNKNVKEKDKDKERDKVIPVDSPESTRSTSSKIDAMNRLMQLFKRRPERDILRDRGILKYENVFGNTLVQLDIRHETSVPNLVRKCIEFVELPTNISTQGLYRSSASLAILQEIRFAINDTDGRDLSSLEKYKLSPDVPSGLLKLFIRELKDPLIGAIEFERMYDVCKSDDRHELKYAALIAIIDSMVIPHRDTLDALLTHLTRVIAHREQNDMTIEGISICWGQSMITGKEGSDPVLMARMRNEVVEMLLKAYDAKSRRSTWNEQIHAKEPLVTKPKRIPQRQAGVDIQRKPKLNLEEHSHRAGFVPIGNYVQVSLQKTSL